MAVNDDIQDAQVSHAIGLERYKTATARKIIALLDRSNVRLIERLSAQDISELGRARLEQLLRSLERIVASGHENVRQSLEAELKAFSAYEVEYQADLFSRVVPVKLDLVLPSEAQIWAAVNARPFQGKLMSEWFSDLEAVSFKRMRDTIRAGYVEGRTTGQIVKDIRGSAKMGYHDGILNMNRRAAETTVRTAVAHTANAARARMVKGNESLIKGEKWVSVLDGRTSLICASRDGTVYPVGEGPRPPAHPNCRSTTTFVTKSWRELGIDLKDLPPGTRASMNGQVSADQTFEQWLRKQPVSFQDDYLGQTKGALFRKGGLSLDKFVDRAGRELSLDELRKSDASAFASIGL